MPETTSYFMQETETVFSECAGHFNVTRTTRYPFSVLCMRVPFIKHFSIEARYVMPASILVVMSPQIKWTRWDPNIYKSYFVFLCYHFIAHRYGFVVLQHFLYAWMQDMLHSYSYSPLNILGGLSAFIQFLPISVLDMWAQERACYCAHDCFMPL